MTGVGEGGRLTYTDAVKLLDRYGRGESWQRHCYAVSQLAFRFGTLFSGRYDIDLSFLRTAALLHDIGRYKTHDPIMHGVAGYRLLTGLGYHREAFVCASHVLFGMERDRAVQYGLPPEDFLPRSFEERLVPVLDSLVEFDRPTTIERRLSSIHSRYKDNPSFLEAIGGAAMKAREFIGKMDREFRISMEQIAAETLDDASSSAPGPSD